MPRYPNRLPKLVILSAALHSLVALPAMLRLRMMGEQPRAHDVPKQTDGRGFGCRSQLAATFV